VRRLTTELEDANARSSTPEKTESTSTAATKAAEGAAAPMSASRERAARERVAWESERSQLMAEVALLRQQAATVAEVTAEAAARDGSSDVSAPKPSTTGGGGSVSFASAECEAMVDDGDSGLGGDGAGAARMMGGDLDSVRRDNSRLAAENAKLRKEQQAAALRAQVETFKTKVRARAAPLVPAPASWDASESATPHCRRAMPRSELGTVCMRWSGFASREKSGVLQFLYRRGVCTHKHAQHHHPHIAPIRLLPRELAALSFVKTPDFARWKAERK